VGCAHRSLEEDDFQDFGALSAVKESLIVTTDLSAL